MPRMKRVPKPVSQPYRHVNDNDLKSCTTKIHKEGQCPTGPKTVTAPFQRVEQQVVIRPSRMAPGETDLKVRLSIPVWRNIINLSADFGYVPNDDTMFMSIAPRDGRFFLDALLRVYWFSLIWKNRLVELVGKEKGTLIQGEAIVQVSAEGATSSSSLCGAKLGKVGNGIARRWHRSKAAS